MRPLYCFLAVFAVIVTLTYLIALVLIQIFTEKIKETGPSSVVVKVHTDGKEANRFYIRRPKKEARGPSVGTVEPFKVKGLVQKVKAPPKRKGRLGNSSKKRSPPRKRSSHPRRSKERVREGFANPLPKQDPRLAHYTKRYQQVEKKFKNRW